MSEINRVDHETDELWLDTNVVPFGKPLGQNIMLFDPSWVDAAVNSLKVKGSVIKDSTKKEPKITFTNDKGGEIGSLYVENGILKFKGDFDESAREFLRSVNLGWQEEIEMTRKIAALNEREQCLAVIDDWASDPYALVTELVKKIKNGDCVD